MRKKELELSSLDKILSKTVEVIEKSKNQIFEIAEEARSEKEKLIIKLDKISEDIKKIINEVDKLEGTYNRSRKWLVKVSQNFKSYSEADIQKAYEEANQLQLSLFLTRERELNLKTVRNDLQLRLKTIDLTIEKAEVLVTQIGVVYDYLTNDIAQMSQLVESAKVKQLFGLKIIQAQEEERKRVARDIHDGPAQSMANVVLRTEIAERLMNHQQIDLAVQELKDLKKMVRRSLGDVRKIIFDLRPMALDDLGLIPTLRKFIPELAKRENIVIDLSLSGKERRLTSGMEVAIFRMMQEILTNVVKHAKASVVITNIEYADIFIKVSIQDNGIGFIEEEVVKDKNHFGLIGMKERIDLLDGELEINSSKNKGTTVTFIIPTKEGEEKSDESKKKD